jgi:hypothetical protein
MKFDRLIGNNFFNPGVPLGNLLVQYAFGGYDQTHLNAIFGRNIAGIQ